MGWLDCGLGALQAFYTGYAFNPLSQLPLASARSSVGVFVLNYHLRQLDAKCILSTQCLPHPSLGTFLLECSYRPLGKMSVQM